MSKPKITVNTFTNGAAILQFEGDVRSHQIDAFREMWTEAWEKSKHEKTKPVFSIGNTDVEVIEHRNPLGEEWITFDALSHAFGSLGWEVESG